MSNRTQADEKATFAAELIAAHEAQIKALLDPGLDGVTRVRKFAKAARFTRVQLYVALHDERRDCTAARAVWQICYAKLSLFAHLPGCYCPVMECMDGVPLVIIRGWNPDRAQLEVFARIQQKARLEKC